MYSCTYLFIFNWLCSQCAEVPWPGMEPKLQQWPTPLQWQRWILNTLHHQATPSMWYVLRRCLDAYTFSWESKYWASECTSLFHSLSQFTSPETRKSLKFYFPLVFWLRCCVSFFHSRYPGTTYTWPTVWTNRFITTVSFFPVLLGEFGAEKHTFMYRYKVDALSLILLSYQRRLFISSLLEPHSLVDGNRAQNEKCSVPFSLTFGNLEL